MVDSAHHKKDEVFYKLSGIAWSADYAEGKLHQSCEILTKESITSHPLVTHFKRLLMQASSSSQRIFSQYNKLSTSSNAKLEEILHNAQYLLKSLQNNEEEMHEGYGNFEVLRRLPQILKGIVLFRGMEDVYQQNILDGVYHNAIKYKNWDRFYLFSNNKTGWEDKYPNEEFSYVKFIQFIQDTSQEELFVNKMQKELDMGVNNILRLEDWEKYGRKDVPQVLVKDLHSIIFQECAPIVWPNEDKISIAKRLDEIVVSLRNKKRPVDKDLMLTVEQYMHMSRDQILPRAVIYLILLSQFGRTGNLKDSKALQKEVFLPMLGIFYNVVVADMDFKFKGPMELYIMENNEIALPQAVLEFPLFVLNAGMRMYNSRSFLSLILSAEKTGFLVQYVRESDFICIPDICYGWENFYFDLTRDDKQYCTVLSIIRGLLQSMLLCYLLYDVAGRPFKKMYNRYLTHLVSKPCVLFQPHTKRTSLEYCDYAVNAFEYIDGMSLVTLKCTGERLRFFYPESVLYTIRAREKYLKDTVPFFDTLQPYSCMLSTTENIANDIFSVVVGKQAIPKTAVIKADYIFIERVCEYVEERIEDLQKMPEHMGENSSRYILESMRVIRDHKNVVYDIVDQWQKVINDLHKLVQKIEEKIKENSEEEKKNVGNDNTEMTPYTLLSKKSTLSPCMEKEKSI